MFETMADAMKSWTRTTSLAVPEQSQHTETWSYLEGAKPIASFDVRVTIGKPLDVIGLKGSSLEEIKEYASFLRRKAGELYNPNRTTIEISNCPCCAASTAVAGETFPVFGIAYKRCRQCGHAFVGKQPTQDALAEVFADSEEHASTYVDKNSFEVRLSQVVKPKLDWLKDVYHDCYGRDPRTLLDVGAGGGHFVEVSRRAGIHAEGFEISKTSRDFAKSAFDIDLREDDFLSHGNEANAEVVTFWGLLEYTPEPRRFIEVARKQIVGNEGLLVVEVPRFDCVGTRVQAQRPDSVARHLDPTSHVNCFSDASLATALYSEGLRPVAAWYFGMDAYELFVQLSLELEDDTILQRSSRLLPALQASFDTALACDDIIIAAIPI